MEAKYTAELIAHWFIWRNLVAEDKEGGDPLTLLKLLKLMYYAEGLSLAMDRGSLFADPIVAWRHGPVVIDIWEQYTNRPYNLPLADHDKQQLNQMAEDDENTMEETFLTFGQFSAWKLRNMTHEEKPWLEATEGGRIMNREISRDTMRQYFKENYLE